jgi:hypothetical protein
VHQIKLKLSHRSYDLVYYTNNVSIGIRDAMNLPSIKKDKECFKQLLQLKQQIKQVSIPYNYNQIRMDDIRETDRIREQAYSIVAKYLD